LIGDCGGPGWGGEGDVLQAPFGRTNGYL